MDCVLRFANSDLKEIQDAGFGGNHDVELPHNL